MNVLTSVNNPAVKAARALKTHKARQDSGLHLAEGPKALSELLAFHINVERAFCDAAFISEHAASIAKTGAELMCVSENVLDALSDTRAPQGAVFVVKTPVCPPGAPSGLVLALDGVQDPGNLGTLLRAADAFGASFVLLGEGCAEPFSPKAVRASAFSCYHLPIRKSASLLTDLLDYKSKGFKLFAADVHGEEDLTRPRPPPTSSRKRLRCRRQRRQRPPERNREYLHARTFAHARARGIAQRRACGRDISI